MLKDVLQPRYGCAVELALDVIGGKWKVVVLAHLKEAPRRYGELRSLVPGVSDKMLTQRLSELTSAGLVERDRAGEYVLSSEGQLLAPALQALYDYGTRIAAENGVELTTPG